MYTCIGKTKKGEPCKKKVSQPDAVCVFHKKQLPKLAMEWYENEMIAKYGKEKWEKLKKITL